MYKIIRGSLNKMFNFQIYIFLYNKDPMFQIWNDLTKPFLGFLKE